MNHRHRVEAAHIMVIVAAAAAPCLARGQTTNFSSSAADTGSCVTPWGNVTVPNGGIIADVPYFSDGTFPPGSAFAEGSQKCQDGAWVAVPRDHAHDSCVTPWQNITVHDGQVMAAVPYFTNGNSSPAQEAYGTSFRCANGRWVFIPK
jgi:hypothetical protein